MEIIIIDKRTNLDKNEHPYDIAYTKQFTVHESGTFANEFVKNYILNVDPGWYDEGKNHIVDGMKFSRDIDCEEMFIKVDTVEELFQYLEEQQPGYEIYFNRYYYDRDIPVIALFDRR